MTLTQEREKEKYGGGKEGRILYESIKLWIQVMVLFSFCSSFIFCLRNSKNIFTFLEHFNDIQQQKRWTQKFEMAATEEIKNERGWKRGEWRGEEEREE